MYPGVLWDGLWLLWPVASGPDGLQSAAFRRHLKSARIAAQDFLACFDSGNQPTLSMLVGSLTDIYQPQIQALDTTLSPVSSYPFVLTVDKYAIETMSFACSLTPSAVRPVAGRGLLDICPCSESSIMQTSHCDHALEVLQSP